MGTHWNARQRDTQCPCRLDGPGRGTATAGAVRFDQGTWKGPGMIARRKLILAGATIVLALETAGKARAQQKLSSRMRRIRTRQRTVTSAAAVPSSSHPVPAMWSKAISARAVGASSSRSPRNRRTPVAFDLNETRKALRKDYSDPGLCCAYGRDTRERIRLLRERAARLREIGHSALTPLSLSLAEMADELEQLADELDEEARSDL